MNLKCSDFPLLYVKEMELSSTIYLLINSIVQSLDQYSQLFENGITDTMTAKNHGIIVLDLSGTQDMSIFRTRTVHLECTIAKPLTENVPLISLNQFETYWETIPNVSDLLDLAP